MASASVQHTGRPGIGMVQDTPMFLLHREVLFGACVVAEHTPFESNGRPTFMTLMPVSTIMANRSAPPPPPPNGSMMTMLLVMILMTFLIINPNIRNALGNMADPVLAPILPETEFFVLTVLILGTFSMTMNTVLRNFFADPIEQAHIGHRQSQVRKMMNDGRMNRDPILMEKANTLREQMMPEQLKVQMSAMRPMMFTMIFIIGIFAWLTTAVESFRVDYVSFLGLVGTS